MNKLAISKQKILPMSDEAIGKVKSLQNFLSSFPQVSLETDHVIHAGMYARTVTLPAGTVTCGALMKIPSVLIVDGNCKVFIGDDVVDMIGYNVIPASAHRKQAVLACEETKVTMIFVTNAKSIEEAEREFTDEHEGLMTRKGLSYDTQTITGEQQ
jgi:hypothetical protein